MKKTKKAWKEFFEEPSNWEPHTWVPEFGFRITRLKETDLYALEQWHEPNEWVQEMGVKPSWQVRELFTVHESADGQRYPESITKTSLLEALYKGEYQEADND